ncbi:hypothetical protein BGZ76_003388 [Entomortierella beljakovae]|nr:hypothetical protein BGZ76_003388 [Entomortierella beljakovae]
MAPHQTLLHPTVALHDTQHQQHHQSQQQFQHRPVSPSSLEDLSESATDALLVDSADSEHTNVFGAIDSNIELGPSMNCSSTPIKKLGPSESTKDHNGARWKSELDSMMATPPHSPTNHQFIKDSFDEDVIDVKPLEGARKSEEKKNPASRARAGSAPPAAGVLRSLKTTPPAVPVPGVPSAQYMSGQSTSAWTALLPGVAPVRLNPSPTVKLGAGSSGPNHQPEQRTQQSIPICLPPEQEARLTMEMYSLFENLLPTEESHRRRTVLISKIEHIIHSEWPGQDIKVLPFGSTVNDLGTNTSDVDVCIVTSWLGLQGVEMLADVFRKHGMENVFCVPEAKVPIVKLWDSELQLSCDMNINTQLGIMNSRMVKTYVAIDPRVRPFAMIIKQWARKRVLNDAATGGTISTYAWICMVINFLQMRSPPILPSLHDMDHELSPDNQVINGNNTSFFSDLSSLEGYGHENKESLGGLLYAFFRRFAIEYDYEHHAISVRHGCYVTKESKGWHIPGKHYRLLCVEEPFDTTRNLGNSCDMASSKGLKQEFRRAMDILNHSGSLDYVCEQWTFPPYHYHAYRSGSNSNFLANNQITGRRYYKGYQQFHSRRENNDRTEGYTKQQEFSRHPRTTHVSQLSGNRPERTGYDKRPRSSSATYSRDITGLSMTLTQPTGHANTSKKALEESVPVDTKVAKKSFQNFTVEDLSITEAPQSNRARKPSVHVREDSAKPIAMPGKQGSRSSPTKGLIVSSSPTRSKQSTKAQTLDGPRNGGQKGSRSNAANRDGHHGSKTPRPTVELCLADIAKIVNKSELPQLPAVGAETDDTDFKKRKPGKKSVIWSTNSNRGESRKQQEIFEQVIARPEESYKAGP